MAGNQWIRIGEKMLEFFSTVFLYFIAHESFWVIDESEMLCVYLWWCIEFLHLLWERVDWNSIEIAYVQEADQKLLERLAEQEAQDQHIQSARREKARADAAWMKKVSSVVSYVVLLINMLLLLLAVILWQIQHVQIYKLCQWSNIWQFRFLPLTHTPV